MSQNGQKLTSLITSLTKNLTPKTKKLFSHCRLEDLLNVLRIWTAIQHNQRRSYAVGKATENYWFWADFKVQIYCTLAAKVLTIMPLLRTFVQMKSSTSTR